jgi:MFS family permease
LNIQKFAILIGLLLCMGASTIMQTYFSSALPAISIDFQSVSYYSWIHGSYILAQSAVIILSSGLCQRFGNKKNFIAGSFLFGIGTVIAPFSGSMLHLVIARSVMGIGAGVVIPATYGIIGEQFEKKNIHPFLPPLPLYRLYVMDWAVWPVAIFRRLLHGRRFSIFCSQLNC